MTSPIARVPFRTSRRIRVLREGTCGMRAMSMSIPSHGAEETAPDGRMFSQAGEEVRERRTRLRQTARKRPGAGSRSCCPDDDRGQDGSRTARHRERSGLGRDARSAFVADVRACRGRPRRRGPASQGVSVPSGRLVHSRTSLSASLVKNHVRWSSRAPGERSPA